MGSYKGFKPYLTIHKAIQMGYDLTTGRDPSCRIGVAAFFFDAMTAVRIVVTRSETYCSIPKFWGPNSVQPRKIAGILLPFFTVVVSPLRWNPGAVHSPLPQRRGKQAISRFTKQCPEQRSDQYHQKVLVYQIHNTFRIQHHRRKSNSSQGNTIKGGSSLLGHQESHPKTKRKPLPVAKSRKNNMG